MYKHYFVAGIYKLVATQKIYAQKMGKSIKEVLDEINKTCKKYEHLLQTVGIVVGLYLLFLTYKSVDISNEQLKILQKQEVQKQLPIWEFEIDDKEETAKLKSFTQDVKLEEATAYFSEKLFYKKSCVWEIDQPEFKFHLTLFKSYIENLIIKNYTYDPKYISIASRNHFPVGIEIGYVQFGERRQVSAIFSIEYIWTRSSEESVDVNLKGIKFIEYLNSDNTIEKELKTIIDSDMKDIKVP